MTTYKITVVPGIERVSAAGKVLTKDLGGDATTTRFTEEIISNIE